jgi:hypothetical protein
VFDVAALSTDETGSSLGRLAHDRALWFSTIASIGTLALQQCIHCPAQNASPPGSNRDVASTPRETPK